MRHWLKRRLVLVLLSIAAWPACRPVRGNLHGLRCKAGDCLEGFICHPDDDVCVPLLGTACPAGAAELCPDEAGGNGRYYPRRRARARTRLPRSCNRPLEPGPSSAAPGAILSSQTETRVATLPRWTTPSTASGNRCGAIVGPTAGASISRPRGRTRCAGHHGGWLGFNVIALFASAGVVSPRPAAAQGVPPRLWPQVVPQTGQRPQNNWWKSRPAGLPAHGAEADSRLHAALDGWISMLLPPRPLPAPASQASLPGTAEEHLRLFEGSADHGVYYAVKGVRGPRASKRVVWVIPQVHRVEGTPLAWSSGADEVAAEQDNIDRVVTTLVLQHGLRCVGSEGRRGRDLARAPQLDQTASRMRYLADLYHTMGEKVGPEEAGVTETVDRLLATLTPFVERHARMSDGVGAAMTRLRQHAAQPGEQTGAAERTEVPLRRVGLDSDQLTRRAEQLLERMRQLDPDAAAHVRLGGGESYDERQQRLMRLWLREYRPFASQTLRPIEQGLEQLRSAVGRLQGRGAQPEAEVLTKIVGQIRVLLDDALDPEQVSFRFYFYQELHKLRHGDNSSATGEGAGPGQGKRPATELQKLQAEYDSVISGPRVRHLAKAIRSSMPEEESSCAAVVAAADVKSVVRALRSEERRQTRQTRESAPAKPADPLVVIVVRPSRPGKSAL